MRSRPILAFALGGFAFLAVFLLVRTTGIHCDENSYLQHAASEPFGDAAGGGKPVLFYLTNYGFYQLIGRHLGPIRSFSLQLFYAAIFAACFVPIALGAKSRRHSMLAYACALASPLVLMNSTQLMMETLVLPPLAVAFALCLRDQTKWTRAGILICSAIAMATKATALTAIAAMALAFYRRSPKISIFMALGILSGTAFHQLTMRFLVHPVGNVDYGNAGRLLQPHVLFERLHLTGEYLYAWLWFGGAFALLALIVSTRVRDKDVPPGALDQKELAILVASSLAGTLLLQFASVYDFVRYAYPSILIGLLAALTYLLACRPRVLAYVLPVHLLVSSALAGSAAGRFDRWPSIYVYETAGSAGTAFFGLPIHGLTFRQALEHRQPCIVDSGDQVMGRWTSLYLSYAWPGFQEERDGTCGDEADMYYRENSGKPEDAATPCKPICPADGRSYSWQGCSFQKVVFFGDNGELRRDLCWRGR